MKKDFDKHLHLTLDKILEPNVVLRAAVDEVKEVLVIGTCIDGGFYIASSHPIEKTISLAQQAVDDLKSRMEE